jgi:hypothetical protein
MITTRNTTLSTFAAHFCRPKIEPVKFKGWLCVDLDTERKGRRASYERCTAYVLEKLESLYA